MVLFIYYTKLSDVRCIGYDTIICRYNNENGTNNDLYCECYNQPVNVLISTKLNNLHHTKNWLSNWLQTNMTYIILNIILNCTSYIYKLLLCYTAPLLARVCPRLLIGNDITIAAWGVSDSCGSPG